jgi:protein-tyrosine phosphatase
LGRVEKQTWFRSWLIAPRRQATSRGLFKRLWGAVVSGGWSFVSLVSNNKMAKRESISLAMNTRVLFVCMGNICRSPMAEGVFKQLVRQAGLDDVVKAESAGTHAFHNGESPDKRSVSATGKRGYDISEQRARRIKDKDFEDYDMILAMDWENLALLQQTAPKIHHHKIQLLMRYATEHETATIPDPYYGGVQGFEQALDYIEDACTGLLDVARRRATQVAAA